MALTLMYITNDPQVALIAEENGVDRIWVDLETLGKEDRQKNMNTVKSHHTVQDVERLSGVLSRSELLVRINPWNPSSRQEIEQVIRAGADRIMLPMWKNAEEVNLFLQAVDRRVSTTLLLETKEAVSCLDEVLQNPLVDEIHIGLNDLHLSYGLTFMFELLTNGTIEGLCNKLKRAGVPYGFGGIARIGEGMLPAEQVIMEHYRLGSTRAILSRSFCNTQEVTDVGEIKKLFYENMNQLREYEASLATKSYQAYEQNRHEVEHIVAKIAMMIKEAKR